MYQIIDVSEWKQDRDLQVSGTREKHWVKKNTTSHLLKLYKYSKSEIWAEKITSEIGKAMNLKMMDVDFALYQKDIAVILKNFISVGETMSDGGEILASMINNFNPETLEDYSIENIINTFEEYFLLNDIDFASNFIPMCVFDVLIANQDRHCENWAIIQKDNGISFAPIYDNGASLGFNSTEKQITEMLTYPDKLNTFNNRSKTIIEVRKKKKPKSLILLEFLNQHFPETFEIEMNRVSSLKVTQVKHILTQIPAQIMNKTEKEWVLALIVSRQNWLLNWYKEVKK